ncbi:MAG: hypothetical protein V1903_12820 [Bacteroidota bacterium]
MNKKDIKYKVWFFGGGETRDDKFNVFTGSFIRLMKEIMGNDFDFIRGVYFNSNMINVIWMLNNCQRPLKDPFHNKLIRTVTAQIFCDGYNPDMQLVLVSSSTGSIVAAQVAVYLAEQNKDRLHFRKPIHLGLGSSVISKESELYRRLIEYQKEGSIGTIVLDDLLDKDDNSHGTGGTTRWQAYSNAFGLMFPFFSRKFSGPSFLNIHPVKGHIHRKRSQTVQKAIDYIDVLLIKHKLAGGYYSEKAVTVIKGASSILS